MTDTSSAPATAPVDPGPPPPRPAGLPTGSDRFFSWVRGLGVVRADAWLGGVCGGLAARLRIDPIVVRGIFVVVALVGFPALLVYAIAWALLPDATGRIHLRELFHGRFDPALIGILIMTIVSFVPVVPWLWNALLWPVWATFGGGGYPPQLWGDGLWGSPLGGIGVILLAIAVLGILHFFIVRSVRADRRTRASRLASAESVPAEAPASDSGDDVVTASAAPPLEGNADSTGRAPAESASAHAAMTDAAATPASYAEAGGADVLTPPTAPKTMVGAAASPAAYAEAGEAVLTAPTADESPVAGDVRIADSGAESDPGAAGSASAVGAAPAAGSAPGATPAPGSPGFPGFSADPAAASGASAPGAADDELAQWRATHEAWREQNDAWRRSQQDAERTAREQARRERETIGVAFAAEAEERRRIRRATKPRTSFVFVLTSLGAAIFLGAIAALWALADDSNAPWAAAIGLLSAAFVAALAMVVAGAIRRRSGFLTAVTIVLLIFGLTTAVASGPRSLVIGGLSLGTSTEPQSYTQPIGTTDIWVGPLSESESVQAGTITIRKGAGDTYITLNPGTTLDFEATLGNGRVTYSRIDPDTGEWIGDGSVSPSSTSGDADEWDWFVRNTGSSTGAQTHQRIVLDQAAGSVYVTIYDREDDR